MTTTDTTQLVTLPRDPAALAQLAAQADAAIRRRLFDDYRSRRTARTLQAQDDDLACFGRFLQDAGAPDVGDLAGDAEAWRGVSWGLVTAFVRWQLKAGYAIGTINRRLSTVKSYADLASRSGAIPADQVAMIKSVEGYRGKEARNLDSHRTTTRVSTKKAQPTSISRDIADRLKHAQPDTPQGRRDALLMCLLLDHGLRVGEVAGLQVEHLDIRAGTMTFYREKVDKTQIHRLTVDTLRAALAYLTSDQPATSGPLLLGSTKGGQLQRTMSTRAMNERVRVLGVRVGLPNLSPHDCRHAWATFATAAGTSVKHLQDAGGWSSPAMPLRYAESAAIANEGVRLA